MMMLSAFALAAVGAATLVTSFVSGVLGMAGGMILLGVLLALLPLPAAMLLHGTAQFAANGWRAFLLRRQIDWRVFGGYAAGALIALAFFAAARFVVSKPAALLAMGALPFAAALLPERLQLNVERRWHPFACGLVCVAVSLTAGVAGPILDVFFVRARMGRHAVVATKAVTQSLSHVLKIAYFGGILAAGGTEVAPWLAATVVLLALAGTSLARQVLERLSDDAFRAWTRRAVVALGAFYLASGAVAALAARSGEPDQRTCHSEQSENLGTRVAEIPRPWLGMTKKVGWE